MGMKENFKDEGQCIGCGFCCCIGPCCYGEWDLERHRCVYLTENNRCGCYDIIIAIEKKMGGLSMFGCGCSSTLFNTKRENKINS